MIIEATFKYHEGLFYIMPARSNRLRKNRQRKTKTPAGYPVKGLKKTSSRLRPAKIKALEKIKVSSKPARKKVNEKGPKLKTLSAVELRSFVTNKTAGLFRDFSTLSLREQKSVKEELGKLGYDVSHL